MDMSSDSASPHNSSSESLNGLNLGKKIYFEAVGAAPTKTGGASSSGTAAQPKKGRGGVLQGGQPPRCQVEGCNVDLSDAKAYYSRHKVCGMHSKSSMVIVAGIQQRFCQQCSRFHQLSEFDQGKRSCRRRLAGHNERRRKPQSGSLLSSRFGRLSSSLYVTENNNRGGGFLLDFSSYPRLQGRDAWPRASERAPEIQPAVTGKFLSHPWESNSESTSSDLLLQSSSSRSAFSGPGTPLGECFTEVADSSCALSLLSDKPWDSRSRALGLGISNFMNTEGVPMGQPTTHAASMNQFPNTASWGFKSSEAGSSSQGMPPESVLGQISHPLSSQFSGELELSPQGRPFMELDQSQAYDSTQQMHWSL